MYFGFTKVTARCYDYVSEKAREFYIKYEEIRKKVKGKTMRRGGGGSGAAREL